MPQTHPHFWPAGDYYGTTLAAFGMARDWLADAVRHGQRAEISDSQAELFAQDCRALEKRLGPDTALIAYTFASGGMDPWHAIEAALRV